MTIHPGRVLTPNYTVFVHLHRLDLILHTASRVEGDMNDVPQVSSFILRYLLNPLPHRLNLESFGPRQRYFGVNLPTPSVKQFFLLFICFFTRIELMSFLGPRQRYPVLTYQVNTVNLCGKGLSLWAAQEVSVGKLTNSISQSVSCCFICFLIGLNLQAFLGHDRGTDLNFIVT
jgi:hypothetical protein